MSKKKNKYSRKWMTRNRGDWQGDNEITLWDYRPNKYPISDVFYSDSHIEWNPRVRYKISTFKRYYGFVPEKGTCELIDIEL